MPLIGHGVYADRLERQIVLGVMAKGKWRDSAALKAVDVKRVTDWSDAGT
jgi:hypothetical protein